MAILIEPPAIWDNLPGKPAILADNQIVWDEIQDKPTNLARLNETNTFTSGNLGNTLGDYLSTPISFHSFNGNIQIFEIGTIRLVDGGQSWSSAAFRFQNKIDNVWMGFIQFSNGGFQIGTGLSFSRGVPIRFGIDSLGNINISSLPISPVNLPTGTLWKDTANGNVVKIV